MCIIAVYESGFCDGQEYAEKLAERLSLRYVNAESLIARATSWGGDRLNLWAAYENAPGIFDRFSRNRLAQILLLQAALAEEVRYGNAVCFGLAAELLTVDAGLILRIRLEASLGAQQHRVHDRLKPDRDDAARYFRKVARDKRRWARYLFGTASGSAGRKDDLRISMDQTYLDEACEMVCSLIENQSRFVPTTANLAVLESFAISTRINAALAQDTRIAHHDVKVEMQGDRAILRGYVWGTSEMTSLAQVASLLPAGIKVDLGQVQLGAWDYPYFFPDFLPIEWLRPRLEASQPSTPVTRRRVDWVFASALAVIGLFVLTLGGAWIWMARFAPAGSSLQNFSGLITDSHCAPVRDVALQTADCVRSCVKQRGAQYVLKTRTRTYVLANQQKGEKLAGESVNATGVLDERSGELRVSSVHAMAPSSD